MFKAFSLCTSTLSPSAHSSLLLDVPPPPYFNSSSDEVSSDVWWKQASRGRCCSSTLSWSVQRTTRFAFLIQWKCRNYFSRSVFGAEPGLCLSVSPPGGDVTIKNQTNSVINSLVYWYIDHLWGLYLFAYVLSLFCFCFFIPLFNLYNILCVYS